jgi:multidrug efflux system membrane fusion protein
MRRIATFGLAVALCAGAFALWRALAAAPAAPPAAAPASAVPVNAEPARAGDVPIELACIGTVVAYNVVDVHTQVTGTIEKIGFIEGQTVHPGDLIAKLDPRPFQAALQQAQATLARDQAHLANAQANLGRYVPLLKPGFASPQQVADQQAAVAETAAAIAEDKATIFNAETQLGYTTITSPIDGVTGIRRVDIGNIVQPSTATPIVTITEIQPISVLFTLPQKDLPQVQQALAKGALTAVAYDADDRTKLGEGTLLLVNNTINQSAGTMQLKATFANADRALWPGEFINVRLIVAVWHDAVTVPLSALEQGPAGSSVYLVAADGTVHRHRVSIAETLNGRALIESGVAAGDTVVTAGQYRLGEGVKVALVPAGDPRVQNTTEASAGML